MRVETEGVFVIVAIVALCSSSMDCEDKLSKHFFQGDAQSKLREVDVEEVSLLRDRVVQLTESVLQLQQDGERLKEVNKQQVG